MHVSNNRMPMHVYGKKHLLSYIRKCKWDCGGMQAVFLLLMLLVANVEATVASSEKKGGKMFLRISQTMQAPLHFSTWFLWTAFNFSKFTFAGKWAFLFVFCWLFFFFFYFFLFFSSFFSSPFFFLSFLLILFVLELRFHAFKTKQIFDSSDIILKPCVVCSRSLIKLFELCELIWVFCVSFCSWFANRLLDFTREVLVPAVV